MKITFEDNGSILNEKDIEELNVKLKTSDIETTGLVNVAKRIHHFLNKESRVICKLSPLGGLQVVMSIYMEKINYED